MSLSKKGIQTNDTNLSSPIKGASLNPNAVEFVPFALRSLSGTSGKAVFDRSESSISNNSDDEAHQYWRHQLPDDITPDFKEDESQGAESLAFAGLSIHDGSELSRFSSTGGGYIFNKQQDLSHHVNGNNYSSSAYGNGMEGPLYNGISRHGFTNDLYCGNAIGDESDMNPLDFLASQFPGFAAESLAEVYFTNECDLNLTVEMLTQLELQVDGAFNQNLTSKTLSAPNLTAMDFPALIPDDQNGQPKYGSPASRGGGVADFASAVRKLASQGTGMWKYDRDGSTNGNIGSSRSSHVYGDRLQNRASARGAPVWLETGDAVANMYSELREEARDHARLRNVYFEQARQAYLIGNKAVAKELSVKGQLHNMQMKAAHEKAQESIFRQRNPVGAEVQGNGRGGQERMIDLHGLHVSEAIQVLKHELNVLRSTARAADRRLQVYICVGTGHHTRGSHTITRLPVAVQRYLLEEEGLDYSEPQPGLLRIMIY